MGALGVRGDALDDCAKSVKGFLDTKHGGTCGKVDDEIEDGLLQPGSRPVVNPAFRPGATLGDLMERAGRTLEQFGYLP